jgi:hypothetical protein
MKTEGGGASEKRWESPFGIAKNPGPFGNGRASPRCGERRDCLRRNWPRSSAFLSARSLSMNARRATFRRGWRRRWRGRWVSRWLNCWARRRLRDAPAWGRQEGCGHNGSYLEIVPGIMAIYTVFLKPSEKLARSVLR